MYKIHYEALEWLSTNRVNSIDRKMEYRTEDDTNDYFMFNRTKRFSSSVIVHLLTNHFISCSLTGISLVEVTESGKYQLKKEKENIIQETEEFKTYAKLHEKYKHLMN